MRSVYARFTFHPKVPVFSFFCFNFFRVYVHMSNDLYDASIQTKYIHNFNLMRWAHAKLLFEKITLVNSSKLCGANFYYFFF